MIKPQDGVQWLLQAAALLRKRPVELLSLMMAWLTACFICLMVPLLGPLVWILLSPALSLALVYACQRLDQNQTPDWPGILQGLRRPLLKPMLQLGGIWMVGALLASTVLLLVLGSGSDKAMVLSKGGQMMLNPEIDQTRILTAFSSAMLVLMPFVIAVWFAPMLVAWHQMKPGKAVFYSFFAVWRAVRAFILFGVALLLTSMLLSMLLQLPLLLLAPLLGTQGVLLLLMLLLSCLMQALLYGGVYCSYRQIFSNAENLPKE